MFLNRRPWPDGEVYLCRGHHHLEGRQYGTCLSNADLAAAKARETGLGDTTGNAVPS